MGGDLSVSSEPGKGSTFRMTLPKRVAIPQIQPLNRARPPLISEGMPPAAQELSATILIVDDIAANRDVLSETLERENYEVLLAPDGETALKVSRKARPDIILLDVMMPGMDGFETCRRLKADETTSSIPVIFISAQNETKAMVAGFQAGGVDYITKPFQTEEVLIRVRTHLLNYRLTWEVLEKNRELEAANARLREEIGRREQAESSLELADAKLSLITQQEAERWGLTSFVGRSEADA
jgi:DNA-binding response OmpR family regulator